MILRCLLIKQPVVKKLFITNYYMYFRVFLKCVTLLTWHWTQKYAVTRIVTINGFLKVKFDWLSWGDWESPGNITVDYEGISPWHRSYTTSAAEVIRLQVIQCCKTDIDTLCWGQRTSAAGGWGLVSKESVQHDSIGGSWGLVTQRGDYKKNISK